MNKEYEEFKELDWTSDDEEKNVYAFVNLPSCFENGHEILRYKAKIYNRLSDEDMFLTIFCCDNCHKFYVNRNSLPDKETLSYLKNVTFRKYSPKKEFNTDICAKLKPDDERWRTEPESERYEFMMSEGYYDDDGTRIMFGDELVGYAIIPFKGVLKKHGNKVKYRDSLERAYILISDNNWRSVAKVSCVVSESHKTIYMDAQAFNTYWEEIRARIIKGAKRLRDGMPTDLKEYVNKQVDLLLFSGENKTVFVDTNGVINNKKIQPDIEMQRLYSRRAAAMDDNKIKFVFSKSDNLVHSKTCKNVAEIDVHDFDASTTFPEDREVCPRCRRKVYIAMAIGDDMKHLGQCLQFLNKGSVSSDSLKRFVEVSGMKFHMEGEDTLAVTCREDTWRIEMDKDGSCELWHNNYEMIGKTMRYITSGFHRQKCAVRRLNKILEYVGNYTWQGHLEKRWMVEETEPMAERLAEVAVCEEAAVVGEEKENEKCGRFTCWLKRIRNLMKRWRG